MADGDVAGRRLYLRSVVRTAGLASQTPQPQQRPKAPDAICPYCFTILAPAIFFFLGHTRPLCGHPGKHSQASSVPNITASNPNL